MNGSSNSALKVAGRESFQSDPVLESEELEPELEPERELETLVTPELETGPAAEVDAEPKGAAARGRRE